jgi:hypothetical protein
MKKCQCCKGAGMSHSVLKDHGSKKMESHITPCDSPTCKNGYVSESLVEEYYKNFAEYGKVV